MVRIDGNAIQQIKDHFEEMAKREIAKAVNDPETDDLQDDDIEAIKNKYKFMSNQKVAQLLEIKPKRLVQMEIGHIMGSGWREGYTKSPIKKRVEKRRKQNKIARKSRKVQRRK